MHAIIDLTNWKFHLGEVQKFERHHHNAIYSMTKAGFMHGKDKYFIESNNWQDVTVPHDYCIAQETDPTCAPSHGYKPRNVGWYYTEFDVTDDIEAVLLDFEAVATACEVYVNGTLACRNHSAYTGFVCDVTDYIKSGKNRVALRVDSSHWEGWWYEGAGIYRPARVHLFKKAAFWPMESHILTQKCGDVWQISLQSKIWGSPDHHINLTLFDADGAKLCEGESPLSLSNARLWSPEGPYLYTLKAELTVDGIVVDTETHRVGLRTVEWQTEGGMFLNGERYFVKGICLHQDHAGVGIAVPRELLRWRLEKMKALGCNALRSAHHNPSRELLELCDELGLFVMSENRNFTSSEETLAEVRYLVKNSRNHPSVFIYSLLNEEPWQLEGRGKRIAARLKAEILNYDASRAVTGAINGAENITGESAADVLDVMGMNYSIHKFEKLFATQKKVILATENGPVFATRGEVHSDKTRQVWGNYATECADFGQTIEDTLETALSHPFVAGVFLWSGFDYRGEPQPFEWPSVNSHWGVCDTCGFEKDIYYLVKSYYSVAPVLHLLPAWQDFAPGDPVHVAVFTNMTEVTLTLNGQVVGRATVKECRADFTIPFAPGTLTATGTKNNVCIQDSVTTADAPARLITEAFGDGRYQIINVTVTDQNGTPCANAAHSVTATVKNGHIIGCGNGNPNDPMPGIAETVTCFHGKCQFIVEGTKATVTLCADGLTNS